MKRIALATLVALSFAACAAKPDSEQVFGPNEAQTVRARSQALAEAFNAKNADGLMRFFSGDSVLMPPEAPTMRGKDAIKVYFDQVYSEGGTELVVETLDVGGHGPLAYETGTYSMNRRPESGANTRDRGKYVLVWRQQGGGQWMVDYSIWSSDFPERVQIASR